jgi:hypothetical protein
MPNLGLCHAFFVFEQFCHVTYFAYFCLINCKMSISAYFNIIYFSMITQYITDASGKKVSVILPIKDYEKLLTELEELNDIKAYDRAKSRKSEPIPLEQAIKDIEFLRKKVI